MLRNENGLSIVSVTVAAGALGLIALGLMRMSQNQNIQMTTMDVKNELNILHSRFSKVVFDQQACTNTLTGVALSGSRVNLTQVRDADNDVVFDVYDPATQGPVYGNGKIAVKEVYLSPTDGSFPGANETKSLDLNVIYDKVFGKTYGAKEIRKNYRLKVETNGAGTIQICKPSIGVDREEILALTCTMFGGTYVNSGSPECLDLNLRDDLFVANSIRANSFVYTSDRRSKKEFNHISANEHIERLENIKGYRYKLRSTNKTNFGLIAQEVESQYPEMIQESLDGVKGVAYGQFVPILVEVVKQQNSSILRLEKELKELKTQLKRVK